ncbi:acyl-CoA desaturase [Leptolyngbya iicbica]|uniref:Acyl-CoA desaturase n=2 Tax=Cyanophyceae TaxID=3028117 RepID=A0A4Q7EG33_9CYAN|nr:acyl-CoA desaturase [Leptolyngbya sp. LK]RZM82804.1 acyl-CoA desaturase [Leptolyngbya sp. LK]
MRQYSPLTILAYGLGPTLILFSHCGALLILTTGISWGAIAWAVGWYGIRMLATTAIYHRLLTHNSYRAPKLVLWVGCLVGAAAGQMGPSWWKAHHLAHHQHSDQAVDAHSPCRPLPGVNKIYWSQGGWLFSRWFFPAKLPVDVEQDPFLRRLDRVHFMPLVALCLLSYGIGGVEYFGAFCLSTTLLFHGVQTVNSLCHLVGQQPFRTGDNSRNNALVAVLTLGEGWHNLHHAIAHSSRHGITLQNGKVTYLPDPTFQFIRLLERVSLASRLHLPTEQSLLKRANDSNQLGQAARPQRESPKPQLSANR